jgi:hypothetical protein
MKGSKFILVAVMVAATVLVGSKLASADVISWNYDNNGTVGNPDGSYNGTNVAGVVPVVGWHNSWFTDPTTNLSDDSGNPTTMDIAYHSFNSYSIGGHPGQDADTTYNKELLNGYLNAGPAAWGPPITYSDVVFSEIPYASYDIIVYFSADVAGREGDVTDLTTTFSFNTLGPVSTSGSNALFVQTTDTAGTYLTAANYAVFSGLSGASQTVRVQMRDNDEWAGIAGFQVVEFVPEPSSFTLLGLCGLMTVMRRKSA